MSITAIAGALAPKVLDVVSKGITDPKDLMSATREMAEAAASVVTTEAQGESWLQRNWRPLMMLWFGVLIGAYWFGFVPVNMPLGVVDQMFTLVQIGIGGYVAGRSGEKIASILAPALKR